MFNVMFFKFFVNILFMDSPSLAQKLAKLRIENDSHAVYYDKR